MQWSEVRQLHTKLDGAKQTRNEEQKKKVNMMIKTPSLDPWGGEGGAEGSQKMSSSRSYYNNILES
jgi:hypothetical protein